MGRPPIVSEQTLRLLAAMTPSRDDWRYGYDLSKQTGLKSGTLYPILIRLERHGWLEAQWEEGPPQGRPARRLYRLTATGAVEARALLGRYRPAATLAPLSDVSS